MSRIDATTMSTDAKNGNGPLSEIRPQPSKVDLADMFSWANSYPLILYAVAKF